MPTTAPSHRPRNYISDDLLVVWSHSPLDGNRIASQVLEPVRHGEERAEAYNYAREQMNLVMAKNPAWSTTQMRGVWHTLLTDAVAYTARQRQEFPAAVAECLTRAGWEVTHWTYYGHGSPTVPDSLFIHPHPWGSTAYIGIHRGYGIDPEECREILGAVARIVPAVYRPVVERTRTVRVEPVIRLPLTHRPPERTSL